MLRIIEPKVNKIRNYMYKQIDKQIDKQIKKAKYK